MFRILAVDDEKDTIEWLGRLLVREFPHSKIETARAIDEASQLIRAADESRWHYHAAVLDFKLPQRQGLAEEVDESLCQMIKKLMPGTLVIHITGYIEDPVIVKHQMSVHQETKAPWAWIIDKSDLRYWLSKLIKKLKAYLYGRMIEEQMDKLFGPGLRAGSAGMHTAARDRLNDQKSITLDLAQLFREITAHWDDLDEPLKGRMLEIFSIDITCKPIRIDLLK